MIGGLKKTWDAKIFSRGGIGVRLVPETKTYDRKEIDGRENRVYRQRKSMDTQIDLNNVDGQTRKLD